MGDLSGPGTRAILIGTGVHAKGSVLPDVPSVPTTVHAMARSLVDCCGLPESQLQLLTNPEDPREFLSAVLDAAKRADDVFLLYYVGHGALNAAGDLHLATRTTVDLSQGMAAYQALPFSEVGDALVVACRARSVIIVLDCCYAYRAALPSQLGCALLASADRDAQALARRGDDYPVFSGELIRVLNNGDPRGPAQLTVRDVHRYLSSAVVRAGASAPRMRTGDRAAELVLTKNRAYRPQDDDVFDATGAPPVGDVCPYRGLEPYAVDDAAVFCGRDRLTAQVMQLLSERVWSGGLSVVIGPSGSGKSSLLHAGILPAVMRGDLGIPGSAAWPCVSLNPGADPMAALAERLGHLTNADPARIKSALSVDPSRIRPVIARVMAIMPEAPQTQQAPSRRLLIIVDQLEELFAPGIDELGRRLFVAALHYAASEAGNAATGSREDPCALVVMGLRSDFFGRCAENPKLRTALQERQTVVGAMTADELRAAILEPARISGLTWQAGLPELLLRDIGVGQATGYDPGALPYLSFALLSTWQNRSGSILTVAGYSRTGGVSGAIAQAAERTFQNLNTEAQKATERLLLDMVSVGTDVPDMRRTASRHALLAGRPDAHVAAEALDALAASRLITVDGDIVQLAHEALIRSWPRLQGLINTDREGLRAAQQLAADANTWSTSSHDPSLLYRGTRLADARKHIESGGGNTTLTPTAQSFLKASVRRERRGVRARRATVAVLAVLVIIATVMSTALAHQVKIADQDRDQAQSRQLAAEVPALDTIQPGLARQLAVAAYRLAPTDQAWAELLASQQTPGMLDQSAAVGAVAYDPRQPVIAVATSGGIELEDPATGTVIRTIHANVYSLAFSPDGRFLAAGGLAGQITLWNVSRPEFAAQVGQIPRPAGSVSVSTLAFGPRGYLLAASYSNYTAVIWNVSDPSRPTPNAQFAHAASIALGPGSVVATGDGYHPGYSVTVTLWRLTQPADPSPLGTIRIHIPAQNGSAITLAFSPQGSTLAIGMLWGNDIAPTGGGATIADLTDLRNPRLIPLAITEAPTQMAYSPDGATLAIFVGPAGGSGDVYLWDVAGPRPIIGTPIPASAGTRAIAFSPDSTILTTAGQNRTLQWRMTDPVHPAALATIPADITTTATEPDLGVDAVAFSPNGNLLATAGRDGLTHLWDVAAPANPSLLSTIPAEAGSSSGIFSLAFSPNGKFLATGGGQVRLWNVTNPSRPLAVWSATNTANIDTLAFSPNGRTLAAGTSSATAVLWPLSDPSQPVTLTLASSSYSVNTTVFFVPATTMFWVMSGPNVRAWDTADPVHPVPLPADTVKITGGRNISTAAFGSGGHMLAVGLDDGTIQLWHLPANAPPTYAAALIGSNADALAFSPDAHILAAAGDFGSVSLWDVTNPAQATQLTVLPDANDGGLAAAAFTTSGRILATSNAGGTVDLWDVGASSMINQLCDNVGTSISPAQWRTYLGSTPYAPPCR